MQHNEEKQQQYKEIFLIGLDLVLKGGEIQVLEIQNLYESNISRLPELMGKPHNPATKMLAAARKKYPGLKVDDAAISFARTNLNKCRLAADIVFQEKARHANTGGITNTIPNRGIEAMNLAKWLFNGYCLERPELKKFVPETHIMTMGTINELVPRDRMTNGKRYIRKPGSLCKGYGVSLLEPLETDEGILDMREELEPTMLEIFKGLGLDTGILPFYPMLVQEYVHEGSTQEPVSCPVIRIYAMVVADVSKALPNLVTIIDTAAAYQHVRKTEDPNDFTLRNNRHELCKISPDVNAQIMKFLKVFFHSLLDKKTRILYRHWETLAQHYILNHRHWDETRRFNAIYQFVEAVRVEQRFTQDKLSYRQCLILEKFLHCFAERDAAKAFKRDDLTAFIADAFHKFEQHNLEKFRQDRYYRLTRVMSLFTAIFAKFRGNTKGCLVKETAKLQIVIPVLTPRDNVFFGFFAAGGRDLANMTSVSQRWQAEVVTYQTMSIG